MKTLVVATFFAVALFAADANAQSMDDGVIYPAPTAFDSTAPGVLFEDIQETAPRAVIRDFDRNAYEARACRP